MDIMINYKLFITFVKFIIYQSFLFEILQSKRYYSIIIIINRQINTMARGSKSNSKQKKSLTCQARRSERVSSLPKNNYYLMGSGNFDEFLGIDESQGILRFKRGHKNYRYNDGSDYEDSGRYLKKKQMLNNRMEFLLDWKRRVHQQQIHSQLYSEYYEVKDMSAANLQKYGKHIEALFINLKWNTNSNILQKLSNIKIDSNKLMRKGIAFIWTPKQYLAQIFQIMEKKHFTYVENFQIINFNKNMVLDNLSYSENLKKTITSTEDSSSSQNQKPNKLKSKKQQQFKQDDLSLIKKLGDTNPCQYILQQKSKYFNQGKKTLLMFRKNCTEKIELRHQRTCDVVFDLPNNINKCEGDIKKYVYNMIETLLPKCLQLQKDEGLKMMELWGESKNQRRGWINIVQKK